MGKSSEMINDGKYQSIAQYPTHLIAKIFENVSEGIMVTNKDKMIINVNPAFEFVTGYKANEVLGKNPSVLQSGLHEVSFYINMWKTIYEKGIWQGEIWNRRKTGDIYPEWLTIMAIRDDEGNITNFCGIFTDLSEQKVVESELEKRTMMDSLTDVNNRFTYLDRMNALLEASASMTTEVSHAVFFLDLDRFKQVNDTLGHATGDLLLVEVARRIKKLLRNKDILARYGGDEFIITLTNINHPREAAAFAEQLIRCIEQPMSVNEHEVFVSTSVGVSIFPEDGAQTDDLIIKADKAMNYAKANGRNSYAFYFDELNIDSKRMLVLDAELRKAIENKDFTLHYQPKIDIKTSKVIGVEALVRWHSDKLGHVSPGEFIPYAEETGLIIPMSELIFEMACLGYRELAVQGFPDVPVAVNISSIHFQQNTFIDKIQEILQHTNTSAQNFEIEMTERTVMNSARETTSKLVRLKQLGFKLSIDDFGTGYSSLSYLVRFPLDILKIDRSFIQQIVSLDDKQAVVDAIIQMSHRLKMKVVAEGVETEQQVKVLKNMGCDIVQGYYYSKPLPMDELIDFLHLWEVEYQGRI